MAIIENKKIKPILELVYWFIILFISGFLFTYHTPRNRDHSHDAISNKIGMSIFVAVFYALTIWSLNGLFRIISKKLFD